eukprot:GILK01013430.1.p1 GENE.GILK01013430.1~~GILK01013430.1.p1  ORF type:complete len:124 (-),score=11.29 GILK01013430.1:219-557(-)
MALKAYSRLLRAQRNVFRHDPRMLEAARIESRKRFLENGAESDPEKLQKLIEMADDAAAYLSTSVVQGQVNARNSLEIKLRPELLNQGVVDFHPDAPKSSNSCCGGNKSASS